MSCCGNNNINDSYKIPNYFRPIENYQPYPVYPNYLRYVKKSENEIPGPFPEFKTVPSPTFKRCTFKGPHLGIFHDVKLTADRKIYNTRYI